MVRMELKLEANKEERKEFDLIYKIFTDLLKDSDIGFYLTRRINVFIPFPLIFKRLGVIYHFTRKDSFEILKIMEQREWIKIIPFKGIRVKWFL